VFFVKTLYIVLFAGAFAYTALPADTILPGHRQTNPPAKLRAAGRISDSTRPVLTNGASSPTNTFIRPAVLSIRELLENKALWNSNRVEVLGYYRSHFEYSVLTSRKGERSSQGIWVDRYRIAPNGMGRIAAVSNDFVRVIGTFRVYEGRGAGHLNMCPAEICNLELLEKTNEPHSPGKN
jgi:hypothetical protein